MEKGGKLLKRPGHCNPRTSGEYSPPNTVRKSMLMNGKAPSPRQFLPPRFLILLLFGLGVVTAAPVNKTFFGGVAIKGYDAVAYFEENKPVKGDRKFRHQWNGAEWRFASARSA